MSGMAQVFDSISAINTMNVALAPAMAMGNLYVNLANSMGMSAMNQVFAQQQANITSQAAMVIGIKKIYANI
ncbi:MAG: hypothetical protein ACI8WB_002558 [Phenylobacterium sp.]|jgi:hypothetical protein